MAKSNGKKIFLIEDDSAILEVMKLVLEEAGNKVIIAQQHEDLLFQIQNVLPEIILIDIHFPGIKIEEFITRMKQNSKLAKVPLIVVSADPQIVEIAEKIKANGYLKKPFSIEDLLQIVVKT
ncbi:MAG TPA: response regulator [Patescibacteria group bacterium]|nr:response regulator [Patescibacteria group bacterium]